MKNKIINYLNKLGKKEEKELKKYKINDLIVALKNKEVELFELMLEQIVKEKTESEYKFFIERETTEKEKELMLLILEGKYKKGLFWLWRIKFSIKDKILKEEHIRSCIRTKITCSFIIELIKRREEKSLKNYAEDLNLNDLFGYFECENNYTDILTAEDNYDYKYRSLDFIENTFKLNKSYKNYIKKEKKKVRLSNNIKGF